jgi:hypothetical protein
MRIDNFQFGIEGYWERPNGLADEADHGASNFQFSILNSPFPMFSSVL